MSAQAIFAAASLMAIAGLAWAALQNELTFRDRVRIIDSVPPGANDSDFYPVHRDFDAVTYEQHLRARIMFLNPWRLYTPLIRKKPGISEAA